MAIRQPASWPARSGDRKSFRFQSTLTTGVVSALAAQCRPARPQSSTRHSDRRSHQPGKFRRPVAEFHGDVIGINSAIYTPSGTTAASVRNSISTARQIAQDLITEGRVPAPPWVSKRAWLNPARSRGAAFAVSEGLLIERVTPAAGREGGIAWRRPPSDSRPAPDSPWRRRSNGNRWTPNHRTNGPQPSSKPKRPGDMIKLNITAADKRWKRR